MTKTQIEQILKEEIAKESGLPFEEIKSDVTFFSLGLDSIRAVYILDQVEKRIQMELNPIYFWDYPTIDLLSGHLATLKVNG